MWYWQMKKKKLLKKYNGICFLDAEESNYIGRIVGIEWRPKAKSCTAHFHLVASDDNDKANTSSALYLINEILHDMIMGWTRELNDAFKLIINLLVTCQLRQSIKIIYLMITSYC